MTWHLTLSIFTAIILPADRYLAETISWKACESLNPYDPACRALAIKWRMPVELALDLVALALYDIVIYADDSTSMKYAESGARIDDMKVILEHVTEVATLFDHDGMSIIAFDRLAYIPAYKLQHTSLLQSILSLGVC